jgi:hypothetical protein
MFRIYSRQGTYLDSDKDYTDLIRKVAMDLAYSVRQFDNVS